VRVWMHVSKRLGVHAGTALIVQNDYPLDV
jgi:hypothetical protein